MPEPALIIDLTLEKKAGDKPYGDVSYADPGYQEDGKSRYPIHDKKHVMAAWNYFSRPHNKNQYTSGQQAKIRAKIIAAYKRLVNPDGPPSA